MNERKYWSKFYNSGRIEDYLSYKNGGLESESHEEDRQTQLGAVDIERFRACDRHGANDKQSG